ncbi:hypothetical protein ACFO1B_31960 [Dactylosporangium siamense]|uniref:Uncharacterized protein n=1 Tax=Dactylosporangium siamense TaxID=685454 RepID=A0A919PU82_9ACTN|nr:hypothetical protein [Dactylosporangium siamense]GIG48623.1 hypothetical protein Dsi01nite_066640 [Dactylosporangium siamense]
MIDSEPVRMARPRRVTALSVLLVLGAIVSLLLAAADGAGPYSGLPAWTYALLSPVYVVLAWAVAQAKRWAWWALVALHGANFAVLLLTATSTRDATAASIDLLWPAVCLVLLFSERTRTWFAVLPARPVA